MVRGALLRFRAQNGAEAVCGGAPKRCYGKSVKLLEVFEVTVIKTTKARCIAYSGPLLYISVDCPRGEALLLTSPAASNFIIRIIDDAVKQHKGQLVCGQNWNL